MAAVTSAGRGSSTQGAAIACLVMLLLGAAVFTAGVALPRWMAWGSLDTHAGLWHKCATSCSRLEYDRFSLPEISDTKMPTAWIVTQGLLCTALACILVSAIAYVFWIIDVTNRNAALTAVSFHFLTGVFGVAGVVVFGVFWNSLPNGYAFWMTVGGAGFLLLVGLLCVILEACNCANCGTRTTTRYVRRALVRRAGSDTIPVVKASPRAQVPIAVPLAAREVEVVNPVPALEPPPQIVINSTTPRTTSDDLHVTAVYNGPAGGCHEVAPVCDTHGLQQHSATVYVDGSQCGGFSGGASGCRCYSTLDGGATYQTGSVFRY